MTLDEQLRSAIAGKRLIQIRYQGKLRIAEPHDYGLRAGIARVLVYQRRLADHPPSPATRGWRLLDIATIDACTVLDETFSGTRGPAHQHHYVWDVLFARVD